MAIRADESYQSDKLVDDDFFSEIVPMADYVPQSVYGPNDPFYYPKDFRILNCWECFEAQGKICIERNANHAALLSHTTTREKGNTFCCKQDYNEGYCKNKN